MKEKIGNNKVLEICIRNKYAHYIYLMLIFSLEYLLFRTYLIREILWNYPMYMDQVGYLKVSYLLLEKILAHDFKSVFAILNMATGILFSLQGAIFFLFFGASRLNALTINFIYFVLAQLVVFSTVFSITKKKSLAYFAIGLLLLAKTTFLGSGGIADYRIDFLAFCLYTVFLSIVIKSEVFLSKKWSIVAAIIAGMLILFRFVAATYIFGVMFLFILILLSYYQFNKPNADAWGLKSRLRNAVFCIFIIAVITLPFIYLNKDILYNYYFIGHIAGNEKDLRALEVGITSLPGHLLFYPKSLLKEHYGFLGVGFGLIIFISSIIKYFVLKLNNKQNLNQLVPYHYTYIFLIFSFMVPLILLTMDTSKSPVVANILVAPLIWNIIISFIYLYENIETGSKVSRNTLVVVSALIFLFGSTNYVLHMAKHESTYAQKKDLEQIMQMYEDMINYVRSNEIVNPVISRDQVTDYISADILTEIYYEKTGEYYPAANGFGRSILMDEQNMLELLRRSDIVIFNAGEYSSTKNSPYPFDRYAAKNKPDLINYVRKEMILLKQYSIYGNDFNVYVRPVIKVEGESGDWLLADGTFVNVPKNLIGKFSAILLSGKSTMKNVPNLNVVAKTQEGHNLSTKTIMDEQSYLIYCELPEKVASDYLRINFSFNNYFVPKDLGPSEDSRKLVVWTPELKKGIIDKKEIVVPDDIDFISGIDNNGWVGPAGATMVLVSGQNNKAKKVKISADVILPDQYLEDLLPVEIALEKNFVVKKNLKPGLNNIEIEIPGDLQSSKLLEVSLRPLFSYVPKGYDNSVNKELSFRLNQVSLVDS